MLIEEPYFMKNDDWWILDDDNDMILLSPKAPKTDKVIKSYREYIRNHNIGTLTRGGVEINFDVDNDEEFEKFLNKIMSE